MDSTEFQVLVERIRGGCIFKADADVDLLNRLALTKELQDFEWTPSLYDAIWTALRSIWSKALTALTKDEVARLWKIERLLIQSFNLICKLPEFDMTAASQSLLLTSETVQLIFKRVLIICPSLSSIQHCLHWIYQNRLDLRVTMRKCISTVLLAQSTSLVPGHQKSRHNDGGKGRDHVAPMLELLLCIIEGFLTPLKDADRGLLEKVLMPLHQPNQMVEWRDQIPVLQIYHPQLVNCVKSLIEKSEINEESSSTAAAAAAVTIDCYDTNEISQYQPDSECKLPLFRSSNSKGRIDGSLLVTAVKRLLSFWPQSFAANTPKELLMLHELEALVAMSCPPSISFQTSHNNSDKDSKINNNQISELMDLFLKRVVSSLGKGGDSDNFRTTQRTLQIFKNKRILKIISSLHVMQNCSDDSSEEKNVEKDKNSVLISSPLGQVFCILIPALYRDGKMSWNPTVNKMTVLVLRSLRAVNEQAFERCCKHVLSFNSSTVTNLSDVVNTHKSSAAINTSDNIKEKQIYESGLNIISSNTTSSSRSPPLPCDQSHEHSYSNKKMRSPVPDFDPKSRTGGSQGPRTDSVPAGFHVDNSLRIASISGMKTITATGVTYPLNITGIAPWAVKTHPVDPVSVGSSVPVPNPLSIGISADPRRLSGAPIGTGAGREIGIGIGIGAGHKSGDSSRSGGISLPVPPSFMTVMPRNEMTKGFMTGSYGRPGTTGVPPKAHLRSLPDLVHPLTPERKKEVEGPNDIDYHDKIVSESKNENDNENDGGNEVECDGYDRLLQYMEKCLPSVKVKGGAKNSAHDNENEGGPGTRLGHQHEEGVGHGGEGEREGEGDDDGVGNDWKAVQAASTPTLLPTLRFHDLVFGHELGKGSFGCVKYARTIVRGKSRSDWPEYAVKIISNDTVTKCDYGCAVIREMAVLQMVSHPGFARLISLFRYTHSAYLVLEYAGRGDLHSMVIRRGPKRMGQSPISLPLSHLCTRFILSEVVTALLSMHSIGLSYNDLKPENILITEMGHIKITDFGGCRAFTPVAKDSLQTRCKSLSYTESLRNGDWKDTPIEENKETERAPLFGNTLYDFEDDNRLEGTPAYMPPEQLRHLGAVLGYDGGDRGGTGEEGGEIEAGAGAVTGTGGDAWALGCVASFCLNGRPLFMGSPEEVLRQINFEKENPSKVQFSNDTTKMTKSGKTKNIEKEITKNENCKSDILSGEVMSNENENENDDDKGEDEEQAASRLFITSLLVHDPNQRMSVLEASQHPYLLYGQKKDGGGDQRKSKNLPLILDPSNLHFAPPPVRLPARNNNDDSCLDMSHEKDMDDDDEEDNGEEIGGGGGGSSTGEHSWARRQFSVLWAPMPSSYQKSKKVSENENENSVLQYCMVPIIETNFERSSPF